MPSNNRSAANSQPTPSPSSPAKTTAKYTNRDGSKVITVPKHPSGDSAHPSPTASVVPPTEGPPVNRKKQKRREKAAAKKARAEASTNPPHPPPPAPRAATPSIPNSAAPPPPALPKTAPPAPASAHTNGQTSKVPEPTTNGTNHLAQDAEPKSKGKKKKKQQPRATAAPPNEQASSEYSYGGVGRARDERIWDNSNSEERDRIKQFWLGLREDERRSLVQVEKTAVLKKMKEQQKQTCSCTVCGRKRTAIEEELEGLYDAYYRELEHYATQPAPPALAPSGRFGPMSGLPPPNSTSASIRGHAPRPGDVDDFDEIPDEEDVDAYSDEADDGHSYSDEDAGDDSHSDRYRAESFATNFLTFGNNLTVQGGILTVADDLLQNDGRKFIEMMEQLAERRMQREQESNGPFHGDHHHHHHTRGHAGHITHTGANSYHHPADEDESYDEEDDDDAGEDYEDEGEDEAEYSQDEDYDEEELEVRRQQQQDNDQTAGPISTDKSTFKDTMTEAQRMEEGRRMFQIFAARMFEQRVLKAYRESVSKERSAQLLRELEQEEVDKEKAKEAKAQATQRRKEKEKERKKKQAEEKQKKEAQKRAEQEAQRLEKERLAEEQRLKATEKRLAREAKKKAEDEEKLRKEAERQRLLHEKKENEERKVREAREVREALELKKQQKEEQQAQEKARREKQAREARERKEQQEQAEKERKQRLAAVKDTKDRTVKENRKPSKQDDRVPPQKTSAPSTSVAIPLGPKRQNPTPATTPRLGRAMPAKFNSPVVPVAIPAVANPPVDPPVTNPIAPTPSNPAVSIPTSVPVPTVSNAPVSIPTSSLLSKAPVAAPATRPQVPSQQEDTPSVSQTSQSRNDSPHPMTPARHSPVPIGFGMPNARTGSCQGMGPPSMPMSPMQSMAQPSSAPNGQPMHFPTPLASSMPFPPGFAPALAAPPGLMHPAAPGYPPLAPPFRPAPGLNAAIGLNTAVAAPNGMPMGPPPGLASPGRSYFAPPGLGAAVEPPPGLSQGFGPPVDGSPSAHSRQASSGFDQSPSSHVQPTSRPAPIGRPGSAIPGQRLSGPLGSISKTAELDDANTHLGSSALLGDDEPLPGVGPPAFSNVAPGPTRTMFPATSDPFMSSVFPPGGTWLPPMPPATAFGPPGLGSGAWPAPTAGAFGSPIQPARTLPNRELAIRQLLCQTCRQLQHTSNTMDGFIDMNTLIKELDVASLDRPITVEELDMLLGTEGNRVNGGGTFETRMDLSGKRFVRYMDDNVPGSIHGAVGAPGGIGSPMVGSATPARSG